MKKPLLSLFTVLSVSSAYSQYEGFENWTQNNILILDDYETSANDGDGAILGTTSQSTDAFTGLYSVKLETKLTTQGDTAFGYFVSGDPESGTPGQAVSINNVDSVIGYYKADFQPNDSALFMIMTNFMGTPTGGGTFQITQSQSNWTRFAFYIGALAADSLTIGAANGNPLAEYYGAPGSWIQFDDIHLKSSTGVLQNILNSSFENWSTFSWDDLDNWTTSNDWYLGESSLPVMKTIDSYGGNYALELELFSTSEGDTAWATITNGVFGHSQLEGGVPFTSSPIGFEFYYKYMPSGSDTAWVSFEFKESGFPSQYAGAVLYNSASSYTLFNGFVPTVTPDTLLIHIQAGRNIGTNFKIDNISFIYPVGVNENIKIDRLESYPNPTTDILNIRFELKNNNVVSANLMDVTGKVLTSKSFGNLASGTYNESFNTSSFTPGIYFIEFTIGTEKVVNRFVVK
jgi:hypothetical protein